MQISTSSRKAALLRMVLLFCPALWDGPQPAVVVGGPFVEPTPTEAQGGQAINVNALVDGANHADALKAFRERSAGNTFTSVPIYDPLVTEQREHLKSVGTDWSDRPFAWAEWPAVEQAPKPAAAPPQDAVLVTSIAELTDQVRDVKDRLHQIAHALNVVAESLDSNTAAKVQELLG